MFLNHVFVCDSKSFVEVFLPKYSGNLNLVTPESSMNFGITTPNFEEIRISYSYTVLEILGWIDQYYHIHFVVI